MYSNLPVWVNMSATANDYIVSNILIKYIKYMQYNVPNRLWNESDSIDLDIFDRQASNRL